MKQLFVMLALFLTTLLITGCQLDLNNQGPMVEINEPPSGIRVLIGHEMEIKSSASDKAMIERIELYINGDLIREDFPPIETGQEYFSVLQRWVPVEPGEAQVRVIAYNKKGEASSPTGIVLQVIGEATAAIPSMASSSPSTTPTAEPTAEPRVEPTAEPTVEVISSPTMIPPTVTLTPTLAMPTAGPLPELQGAVDTAGPLNVRAAASASTTRVSWLNANSAVIGIARNERGDWAKIRYGPDNQEGWVLAQRIRWQGDLQLLRVE